jgi:hypothetical protein
MKFQGKGERRRRRRKKVSKLFTAERQFSE